MTWGSRVTWDRASVGVGGVRVVECWVMRVDLEKVALVLPRDDGTWVVREEAKGEVVAMRPSREGARQAAVDWYEGVCGVDRVLRQARRGRLG